jgi:hypothetical protein
VRRHARVPANNDAVGSISSRVRRDVSIENQRRFFFFSRRAQVDAEVTLNALAKPANERHPLTGHDP